MNDLLHWLATRDWHATMLGILSILGAWIAIQQMLIAGSRLRYDLYDRRYKIFEATRKFHIAVLQGAKPSEEDLRAFVLGTLDVQFLFDDEMADYLLDMHKRGVKLLTIPQMLQGDVQPDKRRELMNAEHEQLLWFSALAKENSLVEKFKPYLKLREIKPWSIPSFKSDV